MSMYSTIHLKSVIQFNSTTRFNATVQFYSIHFDSIRYRGREPSETLQVSAINHPHNRFELRRGVGLSHRIELDRRVELNCRTRVRDLHV